MDVAYQLDCEWPQLAHAEVARALPRWQEQQPQLRRFGSPRHLLAFLHSAPAQQTDAPLLALLALARRERLAGRTLLQVVLPALKTQAERIVYPAHLRDEVWELQLYFAWEAICSYPVERRGVRVAANLALQVLHDTTRALQRPRASQVDAEDDRERLIPRQRTREDELPASDEIGQLAAPPATVPAEQVVLGAVAAAVISAEDADLILRTRVDGIRLSLLAPTLDVGYHALRQRRQRAETRLQQFIDTSPDVSKRAISDLVSYEGTTSSRDDESAATRTATGRAA